MISGVFKKKKTLEIFVYLRRLQILSKSTKIDEISIKTCSFIRFQKTVKPPIYSKKTAD